LINGTLAQLEIIENHRSYKDQELKFSNIKYYSKEHQNLALTAISIFKENPLTGAGIKTFSHICNKVNYKSSVCSTHPHSIYPQILSEIGIFGFLIIVSIFFIILGLNLKMKFSLTDDDNLKKSFYVLNTGIIINILPFIPSGSFFNNWVSLISFLPLGFWIYLFLETKKRDILFS
jgi:O-antigen ligase